MRYRRITVLAAAVLAANTATTAEQPAPAIPRNPDDRTIVHVLNRLGFGPAPGEVERVRRTGLTAYIDRQLEPERIADEAVAARLASFETLRKSTTDLAKEFFLPALLQRRQQRQAGQPDTNTGDPEMTRREMRSPEQLQAMRAARSVLAELSQQKVIRAAYSERQLEEVLVDFWFNHFNVFAGKGQTRLYLTEYERDAIRPHVLGRFRDLLGATAHSPAMLFYLDNWQSAATADAPPTETVPRGRSALTPGARKPGRLRRDTPRADRQEPVEQQIPRRRGLNENYARELMELHTLGVDGGYTQKDVQEVARAFTGWTIDRPRQGGEFRFEPRMHDDGEKIVLGHQIKAGGGKRDGEQVLDILAAHPSTARFIATKLARRFVADAPPQALVDRAAARFRDTRGDLRDVVRTIITSPEFFAVSSYRAKVKNPFEFAVSAVRATGAEMSVALSMVQAVRELGMPVYGAQPPTGYADRADAWVNTGALLNRMNFAVSLTEGRLQGIRMDASRSADPRDARESLIREVLAGDLSESTRMTVAKAATVPQAIALILGSPEFQKR